MDFRAQTGAIRLLYKVMNESTPTEPLVPCVSDKPRFAHVPFEQHLERAMPEEEGVSSALLKGMIERLRDDPALDMHGVMVARHGRVLLEADFGAYTHEVWHATFSLCKSVTGMAIGFLWQEGLLHLDDKVMSFFEGRYGALSALTLGNLTVRDLLAMRSGSIYNEAGALTTTDWVRGFLDSMVKFEPGTQFDYNSMNSYLLAAIVTRVSGMSVTKYLTPRLFEPLGIKTLFWETCPMGVERGGWGMYLMAEDELKLGQLYLNGGQWDGRQLLSKEWIELSTAVQSQTPAYLGNYNYGYQLWVGRRQHSWLFNGMFGQNVLMYPDTGIVVVTSAGNSECFQQGPMFEIIEDTFSDDTAFPAVLPRDDGAYEALLKTLADIRAEKQKSTLPLDCLKPFCGVYRTQDKRAASAGLLPLIWQAVQNSYTRGLHSLMLKREENDWMLTFFEGDSRLDLPIDLRETRLTELVLCGQSFRCAVTSVLTTDEDETPVLKVRLSFLEIPCARQLKLFFNPHSVTLKMLETPGKDYVLGNVESFLTEKPEGKRFSSLASKLDSDFVTYKVVRAFEPHLIFDKIE